VSAEASAIGARGEHQALLLMDLQAEIVDRYAAADPGYLGRVAQAARTARAHGVPVVWIVVRFRPGHPEVPMGRGTFGAVRERGALVEGTPAASLHPTLETRPDEPVVTKRRVGAFSGSDLEVILRAQGIGHLALAGIATSGVVLSTVRAAADLDYGLTVLRDACLDGDAEVHRVLLDKVFPRQAEVATVDEWAAGLSRDGA